MSIPVKSVPIQSTAGAIPIKNEKGDTIMQKVKVSRYVSGKRPDYAPVDSSDDEEDEFGFTTKNKQPQLKTEAELDDPRLRRLLKKHISDDEDEDEDRVSRHRRIREPEILANSDDDEDTAVKVEQDDNDDERVEPDDDEERDDERDDEKMVVERGRTSVRYRGDAASESSDEGEDEEELDDEEIERRRNALRLRAKQKNEEELMDVEDEKSEGESEEESSEYEEYSDSEEEENPRLKPVFVRKKDRITIQERDRQLKKQRDLEIEVKKMAEDRRRQTLRIVEDELKKELEEARNTEEACDALITDEENDEEEYEAWKVRELKRIKRDREEREAIEKEKIDIEQIHNMTEEERRNEFRVNPKTITNKSVKGKYKFLQKYYHRGAFYLDNDDTVYKRDYSSATLEDHFDKTILPKVMQVKNFGRSGRTKYTHLVDQDTTCFDSPWVADTAQNLKFQMAKGGGMKQHFDRPSVKKRK
ncbi:microfibrillar-associated protein 1-like [Tubulanus polymorphus]|uniref:microfibrillar-associated protein 1-like n=1 Tax=Tubulanus polymorphus TaxID=672921 RepID=UPI003DA2D50C